MKIKIVGAGFYGCHIALDLSDAGHDVVLFEKNTDIMLEAALKNQHRLHRGFHYPRCSLTAAQAATTFEDFKSQYPTACIRVDNNLYLNHKKSNVTRDQFIEAMKKNNTVGTDVQMPVEILNPDMFDGCWESNEESLNLNILRELIKNKIKQSSIDLRLDCVGDFELNDYDYVLNCTYLEPTIGKELKYEVCMLVCAEGVLSSAITIMDGDFVSVYPAGAINHWTISSVPRTPILRTDNLEDAKRFMTSITAAQEKTFEQNIINHAAQYIDISGLKRTGNYLVIKAKIKQDENDYRGTFWVHDPTSMSSSVVSGKISGALLAAKEIRELLDEISADRK